MSDFTFDGFEPANTTPVPDVLFDVLLAELNESELKVLLYIIRRTSGFKKTADAISLTQFQKGIRKRATGEVLDRGCGVKDRATIIKALTSLAKKGCIQADKSDDPQGDKATSVYRIKFRSGVVGKTNHPTDIGSGQNQPPWFAKPTTGSGQNQPGVVGDSNPQETVIQQDSKQETEIQESTYPASESQSANPGSSEPTHAPVIIEMSPVRQQHAEAEQRINDVLPVVEQQRDALSRAGSDDYVKGHINDNDTHSHSGTTGATQRLRVAAGVGHSNAAANERDVRASQQSALLAGEKKPARGGRQKAEPEKPAFTDKGQKVYDAWCSLFRSPPRAAEKTIDCANDLHDRLVPWCVELHVSCAALLKEIKGFLFATDSNGFYKRGVTLCDIDRDFEKWQSAKTEELEREKKPKAATSAGTVSGLPRWTAPAGM